MHHLRRTILPIILATVWISASEFFRNEVLLTEHWHAHYQSLGLTFPSEPINGAMWGLWSLCYAIGIYFISFKRNLLQTTAISWFVGFVLMWIVTGNMAVLPFSILPAAIPLSMLEAFIAALIITKFKRTQ